MVKSIKWEVRKQIHRSRSVLITIPIVFFVLLVLPGSLMKSQYQAMTIVMMILSIFLLWGAICPVLYSLSNLSYDFVKPTYLLDRSTGRSYLILFLIKLLGNVVYILMTTSVVIIGRELVSKFNQDNTRFFTADIHQPFYIFMIEFAYFYPITVVFVYLAVKSLSQSRFILALFAVLTASILYQGLSYANTNEIGYVITILILGVVMLFGSTRLAEKLVLNNKS